MDRSKFNKLIRNLRSDIDTLAGMSVRKYKRKAARDAKKMLTKMKKDLKRWADLLDEGRLTTSDFEFLVASQASSIKMSALERAGLAEIRVDHFRKSIINLIIDTVFDFILPRIPDVDEEDSDTPE
ncbi:MAG: hypothetical protein AAFV95_26765 [Bacteroidota bacterium]